VGEELIAELSAAYLCAEAGISPAVVENQAAYIQGWVARLKSEKRLIVVAAAKAQTTADYILEDGRPLNEFAGATELYARPPSNASTTSPHHPGPIIRLWNLC